MDAIESDLQAKANEIERQMFKRRVKNPAQILTGLCSALQSFGLVHVNISWSGADASYHAHLGRRLAGHLCQHGRINRKQIVYRRVLSAARKIGFQPGIEDIGVWLRGHSVTGVIRPIPFASLTAALDRLLRSFRPGQGQNRAITSKRR